MCFSGKIRTRSCAEYAALLIWGFCILFLLVFIIYPLGRVFSEAGAGSWRSFLSNPNWYGTALNTLLLMGLSTFFSVLTGFLYAYALDRGGLPFAGFFSFIPVLHLVTPPFVGGLSFILLFGRQGFFTRTLFHQDISLYGLPGLLIAQTLCFFPVAFLIIKGAFEGMNPSLEYAARSAGAGRFRVFRTVTLPLVLPGILSAVLFIAISVLSDFGNPMLIGGRYSVLAVELYTQLTGWASAGTSAVLGIILLIPAFLLFALQRFAFYRNNSRTATIGSRTQAMPPLPLPAAVRILLFLFCAGIAFIVIAQFLAVIAGAFSRIWGLDSRFTLDHLAASFSYKEELRNTLLFAFLAAAAAAALGAFISFFVSRTCFPFRKFAGTAAMIPAALPGSLIGLAFVLAFNNSPLRLTGTRAIIVLAMVICDLPAAYRILSSSIQRIRSTLDDSARALGASRMRLFFTIICPLAAQGLVSAFVYTFVRSAGTLSAVIFLFTFKTKLTSVLILNLAAQGDWGRSAALAFILTVFIFAALGLLRLFGGAQLFRRMFD
ncbi:MAG: iron ABC transporter permease [Treponema sp.]|jgi:iron(III) transport system permease protein|nr:iron ABC transporter permease [Treponema sp.]